MAWDWNTDPIAAGFAWADHAILNQFDEAIWQKEFVVRDHGSDTYAPTVTAGQDVQTHAFLAGYQDRVRTLLSGGPSEGAWLPDGFDPSAFDPTTVVNIDDNSWGPTASLSLAGCLAAAGYSGADFRRDCRRIVDTSTSTTDHEGNTAAAGQLAHVADDLYRVKQHDGTGWNVTPTTGTLADYLSSESAAPNAATTGSMIAGDFIGHWVFAQLRDVLNQMTTSWEHGFTDSVSGMQRTYGSAPYSTWAAAKADVDANWAGTAATATGGGTENDSRGTSDGTPNYTAFVTATGAIFEWAGGDRYPQTAEFWVYVDKSVSFGVFDATGYPGLTNTAWYQIYSSGPHNLTAPVDSVSLWPDPTIQPPWADDPSPPPATTARGFEMQDIRTVLRWEFPYHA